MPLSLHARGLRGHPEVRFKYLMEGREGVLVEVYVLFVNQANFRYRIYRS